MSTPPQGAMPPQQGTPTGLDLAALDPIAEAVESGAGLPEVLRAAARALDASLVLTDRSGSVLAAAARSPADEQALLAGAAGVQTIELRVADASVGALRMRARSEPPPALVRLVVTLVASEVERVRAPARASAEALASFVESLFGPEPPRASEIAARAEEIGLDLSGGASVIVARARSHVPVEDGWRARVQALAERGARAVVPGSVGALVERADTRGAEVALILPVGDGALAARAGDALLRELEEALPGHSFAVGRSRVATAPADLPRAGNEALLAANVAEGGERPILAFEQTGAYRLLLSAMSEDPAELQRFYAETVEPLVIYDQQYETELVRTVEAFLEADGNVAGTAQRLFTHRHTVRYRLERVRELSGLDVGSSDGRERLSLGLKAMRVLGIAHRAGPASEHGAGAGRVPGRKR